MPLNRDLGGTAGVGPIDRLSVLSRFVGYQAPRPIALNTNLAERLHWRAADGYLRPHG
jgi:hypothetical protein